MTTTTTIPSTASASFAPTGSPENIPRLRSRDARFLQDGKECQQVRLGPGTQGPPLPLGAAGGSVTNRSHQRNDLEVSREEGKRRPAWRVSTLPYRRQPERGRCKAWRLL